MSDPTSVSDCIFCKIASGEIPSDKVFETDTVLAFNDLSPQAPVHVLVIPKRHIARLADATDSDAALLGELLLAVRDVAAQLGIADGFRLVANNGLSAGQSVFHIHWHLLGGRKLTWPPG